MRSYKIMVVLGIFLWSCNNNSGKEAGNAESTETANPTTVYFGGDIITMEGDSAQYAESVAVKDGKILFVGAKDEAVKAAGDGSQMVDLQGKTLVPGFVDGHAHFFGFGAQAVTANLLASPDGGGYDNSHLKTVQVQFFSRADQAKSPQRV